MNCEQARQLFDAYLDGELSPSLSTELGAHRLRCPDCRRDLALLEVTGHVVAHDRAPAPLRVDFTDRLLSCTRLQSHSPRKAWLNRLYLFGPLAAAAVVALAMLGLFDRRNPRVAGEFVRLSPEEVRNRAERNSERSGALPASLPTENRADPYATSLDRWAQEAQKSLEAGQENSASLQQLLELKMSQIIEVLSSPPPTTAAEEDAAADEDQALPEETEAEEPPPADEQDP